jgi:uncharacterized membrane-anchored protein
MKRNHLILALFALMVLVQLYVPGSMVLEREEVIGKGKAYKFRTAPVDPNDPFRGKYINLRFAETLFMVPSSQAWQAGDEIYVLLKTDKAGFARIANVSEEKPGRQVEFVKATVEFVTIYKDKKELHITYPFGRFYMEESKARAAETTYNQTQPDTTKITSALVYIKNGDAVLQDVLIDDVPIMELVKPR